FAKEALVLRVEALLDLGRREAALSALDPLALEGFPRARELTTIRGELRASAGRCRDALRDFSAAVATGGADAVAERALYGMGACRATLGDRIGARADLERYLSSFREGRFASDARALLSEL